MQQPDLSAGAAAGKGTDLFARARQAAPGERLVLFRDRRNSTEFVMAVPHTSPWYPLLPQEQEVEITAPDENAGRR